MSSPKMEWSAVAASGGVPKIVFTPNSVSQPITNCGRMTRISPPTWAGRAGVDAEVGPSIAHEQLHVRDAVRSQAFRPGAQRALGPLFEVMLNRRRHICGA